MMMTPRAKAIYKTLQPLILASESPRRRDLLEQVGLTFDVVPSDVENTDGARLSSDTLRAARLFPKDLAMRWAVEKATAVSLTRPGAWVLGADTIVVLEGTIFEKPQNRAEALSMLRRLSGRAHEVITGTCLTRHDPFFMEALTIHTQVHFKRLAEGEILAYADTGDPMDKAGSYGIQGMGAFLVEAVHGSYTNVMGLPLCETLDMLLHQGIIAPTGKVAEGTL